MDTQAHLEDPGCPRRAALIVIEFELELLLELLHGLEAEELPQFIQRLALVGHRVEVDFRLKLLVLRLRRFE
ncbi:hypothetical protein JRI60_48990 [Archangium violaceum]|uniref:hypothetical protein n=1 Tax=Archangium violaceum TaxID=83451 RepID=UPI00194FE5B3|nr:hypothetical protein [Archangium violaceum]QRN96835.1 hypothetical protein JRI60_48990 [Archangium violaceum]